MKRVRCPDCRTNPRAGQRTCLKCHAAYMLKWYYKNGVNPTQRKHNIARSYAKSYVKRGKVLKSPCTICGNPDSQIHHENYEAPLQIIWLCKECHYWIHRKLRQLVGRRENEAEKLARSAAARGECNANAKLDLRDVTQIKRALLENGRGIQTQLARKYGVRNTTINNIAMSRSWCHV